MPICKTVNPTLNILERDKFFNLIVIKLTCLNVTWDKAIYAVISGIICIN